MEDRISSLPRNINEYILDLMPLEDAIRTSILSSTWKGMWASRPSIQFRRRFYKRNFENKQVNQKTYMDVVHKIVSLHVGPIRKFKLFVPPMSYYDRQLMPDMDPLMHRALCTNAIEEFSFHEANPGNPYKLPLYYMFDCGQLKVLSLFNCLLDPPQGFKGFYNLETLKLGRISFSANTFEILLPSARVLKALYLSNCNGIVDLKVDAPCLQILHLEHTTNLVFVMGFSSSTPSLADVTLSGTKYTVYKGNAANLTKLLASMPEVRSFKLSGSTLKLLVSSTTPELLPAPPRKLMKLEMHDVQFKDLDHTSSVLCIIRNSRELKELSITFSQRGTIAAAVKAQVMEYLKQPNSLESSLCQLQTINLNLPLKIPEVMVFIKLLLLKTPLLWKITVRVAVDLDDVEFENFSNKIKGLPSASKYHKIYVCDPTRHRRIA